MRCRRALDASEASLCGLILPGIVVALALFASVPSASAQEGFFVGTWKGTYRCGDNPASMTLTLEKRGTEIVGVFAFGPGPRSPEHPTGSFNVRVQGTPSAYRILPGDWIDQAAGFRAVRLTGKTTYNGRLEGTVDASGCGAFGLDRAEGAKAARSGADLAGGWKGVAACGAGPVAVTLDISDAGQATVSFGPYVKNQLVPEGVYKTWVDVQDDVYRFAPDQWIQHPPGWSMSFVATLSEDGLSLTGTNERACTDLLFERSDGRTVDTDAMVAGLIPDYFEGAAAAAQLKDPSGDLAAYIRGKQPYLFSSASRQFAGGFAAELTNACAPVLSYEDGAEISRLVRSSIAIGVMGDRFDAPDLGAVIGSQAAMSATFAAGVEAAEALECAEPATSEALEFIAELIRLNRMSPEGQTFVASCLSWHTENQCRCLGQLVESLDPDIWRAPYSSSMLSGLIAGNPAIGVEASTSCRIERF